MPRNMMPTAVRFCARLLKRSIPPRMVFDAPVGNSASRKRKSSRLSSTSRNGKDSASASTTVTSGTSAISVVNASAALV